jgi:hypothetical protein
MNKFKVIFSVIFLHNLSYITAAICMCMDELGCYTRVCEIFHGNFNKVTHPGSSKKSLLMFFPN